MSKQFNYISLFSGAGGLDIGLERSGMHAVSLCEIDPVFCETLKMNRNTIHKDGFNYFENATIINEDIRDVKPEQLTVGQTIDVVVGGPPCQSFSSAGKQLSVLDPRGMLINEFYRIIEEVKPKMFLFENVRGIITARNREGEPGGVIKSYIHQFEKLGYSARAVLLNAADYGAFQRRVRCFIIGTRCGEAPLFPEPTHQRKNSIFHKPWKSLNDFLEVYEDLQVDNYTFPTKELDAKLVDIPNGSGLKSQGKKEKTRPGGHWGYRQGTFIADLSLPARTVTGSASQDWIRWRNRLRRLTFEEVKLLQGFPADWQVAGSKSKRYKQIGNAVPSIFGELIGQIMISFLQDFPKDPPVLLGLPNNFKGYINYTKKDHEKNKASRSVHKKFSKEASN